MSVSTRIRIENLTKSYGKVKALDNFSLEVDPGEFMVLLGPSGCGKTTAVRCIAGLSYPNSGTIHIGDQLVNGLAPRDRDIAMVFQNYALYPHMSVYENIAFPLKMRKESKGNIHEKVEKISKLLEISQLIDRKPKELSGGQMQRVALGRALVREPKVFLMDEPLSNLDAKMRAYMRTEIKKLQRKVGITTIYITHDQIEAMSMADRIAIMDHGLIQQVGTPQEVYAKPANTFVAGFIGSPPMNFIECEVSRSNSHLLFEISGSLVRSESNALRNIFDRLYREEETPAKVTLGFRPRDISFGTDQLHSDLTLKCILSFVEMLGDDTILEVNIGNNSMKALTSGIDAHQNLSVGKNVLIGISHEKLHFFNSQTGIRLSA
ncbi:MAG TPA: ABC transporter ATP-binding protein [Nitrososphaeraceae archaeon]|jgi:multiple sugar transport system ATP-binding protein|nr:ABC transporter ATP-binding protein [Nitrososphaeraceae archaeon]